MSPLSSRKIPVDGFTSSLSEVPLSVVDPGEELVTVVGTWNDQVYVELGLHELPVGTGPVAVSAPQMAADILSVRVFDRASREGTKVSVGLVLYEGRAAGTITVVSELAPFMVDMLSIDEAKRRRADMGCEPFGSTRLGFLGIIAR